MNSYKLKQLIKLFIPKFFLDFYLDKTRKYGFFGNYSTWEEAKKHSSGYDSDLILEKVKSALLKVKNGEAIYERDSVLFNEIQYSWPLLAGLLHIASKKKNKLSVIDFGGSLGSSYFQNKNFLSGLDSLRWNIIEQEKFVQCGKQFFENGELKFYFDIDSCNKENGISDVIILSSVLPYLEKPYEIIDKILKNNFDYIILDRIFFIENNERITIQKVPENIYNASYPAWFFNKEKLLKLFSDKYEMLVEFNALTGIIRLEDTTAIDKGFIFKRIDLP